MWSLRVLLLLFELEVGVVLGPFELHLSGREAFVHVVDGFQSAFHVLVALVQEPFSLWVVDSTYTL